MGATKNITWESVPDLSGGWTDSGWECIDWIAWNDALEAKFGREEANRRFNQYWQQQSWYDKQYLTCKYDSYWIDYWLKRDIDVRDTATKVIVGAQDLVGNTAEAISSTTASLGKSINIFGKLIPVVTILITLMVTAGIGLLIYGLAKNPGVAIGTAIKYAK